MDAAVFGFVVVAMAVGAVIGWLIGSRAAAGAKQTVDNLRLQLDEVVKERDSNRAAVAELGALKAAQWIHANKEAKKGIYEFRDILV